MKTLQKLQILAGVFFFALPVMGFSITEIASSLNQDVSLTAKQTLLLMVHGVWVAIWSLCIFFTLQLTITKTPALAGEK